MHGANINFSESKDWETIRNIVTNQKIYPYVSDDFSPAPENYQPIQQEQAHYVLVRDGDELLGLWAFCEHTHICWQVHTCLLPIAYGERARIAAREMAEWIWNNTYCLRVITEIPEYNRLALRFARQSGMIDFGFNHACYLKHGVLYGVYLLGMSRGTN